jgi:hypothetical protein
VTVLVAVTRERALHLWPPVRSSASEEEVLPVIRAEACACGGYVRQCLGDSVAAAVRVHQGTAGHAAWRERTG